MASRDRYPSPRVADAMGTLGNDLYMQWKAEGRKIFALMDICGRVVHPKDPEHPDHAEFLQFLGDGLSSQTAHHSEASSSSTRLPSEHDRGRVHAHEPAPDVVNIATMPLEERSSLQKESI